MKMQHIIKTKSLKRKIEQQNNNTTKKNDCVIQ